MNRRCCGSQTSCVRHAKRLRHFPFRIFGRLGCVPNVVGNGARRSRRFDVARSLALAEYSKFLGLLTLNQTEGRAPSSRQQADALGGSSLTWSPIEPQMDRVPGNAAIN